MKILLTTLSFFIMITSFSQDIKKRQIAPDQIDAVFSKWDTQDKPGIAVGVLNDGKIVYTKGYGLANLEHQIPISPKTKFHIGDIAKEFTVYALLLLEQRGQISLQDDIRKYMPKLSLPYPITIEQLIHHTGGLNNDEVSKALSGWGSEDIFTKDQAYAMIKNQIKHTSKNTREQLPSDAGFMVLEDIIAQIGKLSYENFIVKEIFTPLGMKNSVFDTKGNVIDNKAQGYFAQNNEFVTSTINYKHTLLSDLYTTVGDICLWANELRNPKIGTKKMIKKFNTLSTVNDKKVDESNTALYTGGHRFWNFRGSKKLYHTEVFGGYASKLIRYPNYDLTVIIMGNDGAYNGYAGTSASALYIEDYLDPWPERSSKITSKKLSKKQLSVFEGNYWDINNLTTRKIYVSNDTLRYFRNSGNQSALVPLTNNSFKMITWGEIIVNFNTNTIPKSMDVIVGDNTSKLIAYNSNADWTINLGEFTGNYYSSSLNTTYSLIVDKGKLILTHPRLEPIHLDARITDLFTGNHRHFSSLSFKRNNDDTIKGFELSTRGVNNIWFKKETTSDKNLAKN